MQAHSRIGRTLFDNLPAPSATARGAAPRTAPKPFHPVSGG
ncbi:hypothetical protein [Actinoplanes sp. CA-252034]